MKEVERKFLVDEVPKRLDSSRDVHSIRQGYVVAGDSKELRVRRVNERSHDEVTIKKGEGILRDEITIKVPRNETERLWNAVVAELEKTRYTFEVIGGNNQSHFAELDIYEGDLEGLVVVEVEFDFESAVGQLQPPGWFGREITEDPRFKNKSLAFKTYDQLEI